MDELERDALRCEYSAALLMLVSLEPQPNTEAHVKRLDNRLSKLRDLLDQEDISQAEQVVNKVNRQAKAILAGRV